MLGEYELRGGGVSVTKLRQQRENNGARVASFRDIRTAIQGAMIAFLLDAHLKTCIALLDYLQDCGLSCP